MNYKTRRMVLAIVILALIACVVALGITVWKPEKEPTPDETIETAMVVINEISTASVIPYCEYNYII